MSELISCIKTQFESYKKLSERTFDQLSDDQLTWQYNEESNSIATIVKHLHGNMLSRWTDFLTSDGEKDWRERDAEFDNDLKTKKELLNKWEEGWQCLFEALESLSEDDLKKQINIRNMSQTVTDAIMRQVAHYAYHIGQIVYIGKMIQDEKWNSLSIPKGQSSAFNKDKFSKPKGEENFGLNSKKG